MRRKVTSEASFEPGKTGISWHATAQTADKAPGRHPDVSYSISTDTKNGLIVMTSNFESRLRRASERPTHHAGPYFAGAFIKGFRDARAKGAPLGAAAQNGGMPAVEREVMKMSGKEYAGPGRTFAAAVLAICVDRAANTATLISTGAGTISELRPHQNGLEIVSPVKGSMPLSGYLRERSTDIIENVPIPAKGLGLVMLSDTARHAPPAIDVADVYGMQALQEHILDGVNQNAAAAVVTLQPHRG